MFFSLFLQFDFAKSSGQSLGGAGGSAGSAAATAASFAGATPARLVVDASQPTTTLQLVVAGKRVKETVNQSATVMQLYQHFMSYVERKRTKGKQKSGACKTSAFREKSHSSRMHFALIDDGLSCCFSVFSLLFVSFSLTGLSGFELVAGFPPKPLTNPALTLKEAGLLNGSITQRGG